MQCLTFNSSTPDWRQQYLFFKSEILDAIDETNPSRDLRKAVDKIVKTLDQFPFFFLNAEHLNDYDQFRTLISTIVRKKKTSDVEPFLLKIFNRLIGLEENDLTVLESILIPISQTWAKYISIIKSEKRENQISTLQSRIRGYNKRHTVFLPSELLPLLNVPLLSKYTLEEKKGIAKALCIESNLLLTNLNNSGKSTRIEKNTEQYTCILPVADRPVSNLFQALHREIKQATADPNEYCADLIQDLLKMQPFIDYKKVGIDVPKFLCLEMLKIINQVSFPYTEKYHMGGTSDLSSEFDHNMLTTNKFYKLDHIHLKYGLNFTYRYTITQDKQFITLVVEEPIPKEAHSCEDSNPKKRPSKIHSFVFLIKKLNKKILLEEKNFWGKMQHRAIDKIIQPIESTIENYQTGQFTDAPKHKVAICPNLDFWIEFNKDPSSVTFTLIDNKAAGEGSCRVNFAASSINIPIFMDAKTTHHPMLITRVSNPNNLSHIKKGIKNLNYMLTVAKENGGKIVELSRDRLPDVNGKDRTHKLPLEQIRTWYPGTLFDVVAGIPLKIGSECKPLSYDLHRLLGFYLEIVETMIPQHAAGIIHCDLKPDNILIKTDGEKAEAYLSDVDLASRLGMETPSDYVYWDQSTIEGYISPFSDCYALAVSMIETVFKTGCEIKNYFHEGQIHHSRKTLLQGIIEEAIKNSTMEDNLKTSLGIYLSKHFNFYELKMDRLNETFNPLNYDEKNSKEIKKILLLIKIYSEVFDLAHKIFLSSLGFDKFIQRNENFRKIWKKGTKEQKLAEIKRIQGNYFFMPQIAQELKRILGMF